ncbi:MAG: S8 family serine peptidase, partial [Rhodothermales bacterium]
MRRLVYIALLSSFVYSAKPSAAQVRPDEISRVRREVRRTEETSTNDAREWALARRIPSRIVQRNGKVVELVGMSGRRPIYLTQTNELAAAVTGTRYMHPGGRLGLDLTGAGLEIGIWDGGRARTDHLELEGRVVNPDHAAVDDHATHVAGTLAATGIESKARGMAYESSIRSYSWVNDATEMTNETDRGLLVSNHSYTVVAGWYYGDIEDDGDKWYWLGDPTIDAREDYIFGWYDLGAVQFDRVAYTGPYFLPVVAAGNERVDRGPRTGTYRALDENGNYKSYDVAVRPIPADGTGGGFDTISGAGVAKNVLSVGSVAVSTADGSLRLSSFSSFGPTDDGRIKPDLVGLGEQVYSLASSSRDAYQLSSGTSMAAP